VGVSLEVTEKVPRWKEGCALAGPALAATRVVFGLRLEVEHLPARIVFAFLCPEYQG
jgi:hypothetical protein